MFLPVTWDRSASHPCIGVGQRSVTGIVLARIDRAIITPASVGPCQRRPCDAFRILHRSSSHLETALALFEVTIDSLRRAGNIANLVATVAGVAVLFDRLDRAEIAATIYATTTHNAGTALVIGLAEALDHLRATLGDTVFDECAATGAAMEPGEAVQYVRAQIQAARNDLPAPTWP